MIIDEGLGWKNQYNSFKGKYVGGLSALNKIKDTLPQSKLCSAYHALVKSHIRYADVVWGNVSHSEVSTLQRLQNRALSILKNSKVKDTWPARWWGVEGSIIYDW